MERNIKSARRQAIEEEDRTEGWRNSDERNKGGQKDREEEKEAVSKGRSDEDEEEVRKQRNKEKKEDKER